jgi:hypothetical protein
MTKIILELQKIEFVEGECNCDECRRERLEKRESKTLLQIAPHYKYIPRSFDRFCNFGGRVTNPPGWRRDTGYLEYWKRTLRILKDLETRYTLVKKDPKTKSWTTCIDCGSLHQSSTKRQLKLPDDDKNYYLCKQCFTNYLFCTICEKLELKRGFHKIFRNRRDYDRMRSDPSFKAKYNWVCTNCFRLKYHSCYRCGFKAATPLFRQIDIGAAEGPGERGDGRNIIFVCPVCVEEARVQCHECGGDSWDFAGEHHDDDVYFCVSCVETRRSIHEYYYKPSKIYFHKGKKEGKVTNQALHFGFELEVECRYSAIGQQAMAELIKEKFGSDYVYIVHDGSIDHGIEVVSHPFTWEEFREQTHWDDLLLFLRKKNWKANRPKVGFHVHMTKAAFTSFHLFKFLKFFYDEQNRKFMNIVAQRQPNSYSVFSEADRKNVIANAKDKANRDNTHYNAVNLNNKTTVEVRMFRGTLEPLLFNKNIEFLKAAFNFSRDKKPTMMDKFNFIRYVIDNCKQYVCLMEFFKMEGVL